MGDDKLGASDRLNALRATGLLDSPRDVQFDQLTRLAASILRVPNALVTLVAADRQYVKSNSEVETFNPPGSSQALDLSFCRHVVTSEEAFVVPDAREHPLVRDSGAIAAGVVSYAGVPLTFEGQSIGALCVIDSRPRQWSAEEVETLRTLARSAIQLMSEKHLERSEKVGALAEQPSTLVESLSNHLQSLEAYDQLLAGTSLDLQAEAQARHLVGETLQRLQESSQDASQPDDPELHGLVLDYLESERSRSEATSAFAGGKINLQELQATIIRHDDALGALRLAALDRGAKL
jgi:transcriptional regulator with GAF, ATPase, and Fis domain